MSHRQWLALGLASVVLALASALTVLVRLGVDLPKPLAVAYEKTELFLLDTVRLTFRLDRNAGQKPVDVFAAPLGILDPNRIFAWVEHYDDLGRPTLAKAGPVPVAARLLDPAWQGDPNHRQVQDAPTTGRHHKK
jgi:hypothetical protein